jgi:5S rRNA maturation endonuclease (ribonuclease M5)
MKKGIDEEKLEIIIKDLMEQVVIVEGKRDKKALKSLGLKDIIAINGRPLYEVAEIASNSIRPIVILTDFDKKGRQIEKKLRSLLQKHGKQPNLRLRWKVMDLGKNKIEDFGDLHTPGIISSEEDDFHVKTCTNFDKIPGKSRNRRAGSNRKA